MVGLLFLFGFKIRKCVDKTDKIKDDKLEKDKKKILKKIRVLTNNFFFLTFYFLFIL